MRKKIFITLIAITITVASIANTASALVFEDKIMETPVNEENSKLNINFFAGFTITPTEESTNINYIQGSDLQSLLLGESSGKVLGISTSRRNADDSFLTSLSKDLNNLQRKMEKSDPNVHNLLLIVLIIILSILTLRTEVRFQELAQKYEDLKNTFKRKPTLQKTSNLPYDKATSKNIKLSG